MRKKKGEEKKGEEEEEEKRGKGEIHSVTEDPHFAKKKFKSKRNIREGKYYYLF